MQIPVPLKKGDCLIAIAPSGTLREVERLEKGLNVWRERGYNIVLQENYSAREGYLAGDDRIRRQALHQAWHNREYKGIVCVRGGVLGF